MKVFISADIEGTAFTTYWDETELKEGVYARAAQEMTREVRAAIDGAIAAGATEILVNDAHDWGINIDPNELPECVEIIRGWSGSPMSMVDGIDESFDACMFVGYHAAAGRYGNPLSHTMSTKTTRVTLNGLPCSEFLLYSWAAAMKGVPTVFLAGDQALVDDSRTLHPALETVAVKSGFGGMTRCLAPVKVHRLIRETSEKALRQDLAGARISLPEHFELRISYREQKHAVRNSFFPGCRLEENNTISFATDDYMALLTAAEYCL
ncbi:MAG: M55 family metallopeptidase [Clostridia bacterium]|nr:M55 family metallopeptidase [Clostridia bacterium]MBR1685299.1 M55 family metallopeptidase [Clostridia bacterium]MBR2288881.1 M55 family metallopeptidase [Clostridia bacterium]